MGYRSPLGQGYPDKIKTLSSLIWTDETDDGPDIPVLGYLPGQGPRCLQRRRTEENRFDFVQLNPGLDPRLARKPSSITKVKILFCSIPI